MITVVSFTPAPSGYEISIHGAYSPFLKFAFLAVLLGGIGLIIDGTRSKAISWAVGLMLILVAYAVLYSLPLVRGYEIYGTPLTDSLYHLGVVSDIISNGHIPNELYPATHILFSELSILTGLSANTFQMPVSYLFSVLLITGCFVAGRGLFGVQAGRYVLAAAIPLVYADLQITILPWFYAICFIPLFLLTLHKAVGVGSQIVALVFAVAITMYHPLTSLFMTVVVAVYTLWTWLSRSRRNQSIGLPLAIGVIAAIWAIGSDRVQGMIAGVATGAATGGGVATYASEAANSGRNIYDLVVNFLIIRWGTAVLYMGFGGLIVLWITYRSIRGRQRAEIQMVSAQYVAGGLFGVSLAAGQVLARNPVRISQFCLLFSIFLIGYGLWAASQNSQRRTARIASAILIMVVLSTALLGAGTAYEDNRQVTHTTIDGSSWFLEHRDADIQTRSFRMSRGVQFYIQGNNLARASSVAFSRFLESRQLPKHLGYTGNGTAEEVFGSRQYIITKTPDVVWTESQYGDGNIERGYTQTDLTKIENDPTVSKAYTNGPYDIWFLQ
ncbi:glycosyltransferase family protein [Halococcus hamelinensis]|uniref:hypothetical protein n=1 Tax=Halococcus hamelinensis TaxID=332168 RepID=UPI001ED97A01|nr:hypothetical protein [Halococcus hamelinensis]